MDTIAIELVLIVVAILANGFFSGSEIALVTARAGRLARLREGGGRGADIALRLKEKPESFLATIQIAISLVGVLASAVGGAAAVERLTPWLASLPMPGAATWAGAVALAVVVVVITYGSLVVGELTPKAVALRDPERIACAIARPIQWLSVTFAGLVSFLTLSTNAVLRLLGQGPGVESPFVSEEEVKYLVREGAAKGVFERVEADLVHAVFEFADRTVREIMVPRVNIAALDVDMPPDELIRRAAEIAHSRIPVYRGSIERPIGVVTVLDLFRIVARGEPLVLSQLLRPVLFVPESARISGLLRDFQRSRHYLALVVDEYGGVVGLITLEDVLEEIVGDIREVGEQGPGNVTRLPDGSVVADGSMPVRDLRQTLRIPVPDSPGYTTVAGVVIDTLGAIPNPGASISHDGWRWTVVDMDGPRVTRVKIQPDPAARSGATTA